MHGPTKSLVAQKIVSPARGDNPKAPIEEMVQARHVSSVRQKVGPLRTVPVPLQFGIADENCFGIRRIAAVLKVGAASVPEKGLLIGIEESCRERVVGITFDEAAGR